MGLPLFPSLSYPKPAASSISTNIIAAEKKIYYITVEKRDHSRPYASGGENKTKPIRLMWENVLDANHFLHNISYIFSDWYAFVHIRSYNASSQNADIISRYGDSYTIGFHGNVPHQLYVQRGFCHERAWWSVENLFDGNLLFKAQVKSAVLRPSTWHSDGRIEPVSTLGSFDEQLSRESDEDEEFWVA